MTVLNELEIALGIKYPDLYKQLFAKGMLNLGPSSRDWYTITFPKLKQQPPLLLFGEDIEIWNPEEFKSGILEINDTEVYDINAVYRFVPFAKNGAGDLYVFQYDLQKNEDIPITFFPHDSCEAEVLAKNLQDFIFRQLLEATREIDDYSLVYEEDKKAIKVNFKNQLHTHRPYLTDRQIEILSEIYERDLVEYSYSLPSGRTEQAEGFTTFEEVEAIIKREINFDSLYKTFDYTI